MSRHPRLVHAAAIVLALTAPAAAAFDTTIPCDGGAAANLAAAVAQANNTPGTDTIRLVAGCTYLFDIANGVAPDQSPSALSVTDSLVLVGNGATLARRQTAPPFRLLNVTAGDTLTVSGLTFVDGLSRGDDGRNGGSVSGVPTPGGVYAGRGGAILAEGVLLASEVRFLQNAARGGNGGAGANGSNGGGGGAGLGGAVYVTAGGSVLQRCLFANNTATGGNGGTIVGGAISAGGGGGGPGGAGGYYTSSMAAGTAGGSGGFGGGGGGMGFSAASAGGTGGLGGFGGGGGGTFSGSTGGQYGGNGESGGGGGAGLGGALFVDAFLGAVSVVNCTFSYNSAFGGNGARGGGGGSGAGGSIFLRTGLPLSLRFATVVGGAAVGGNAGAAGNGGRGGSANGGNIHQLGGNLRLEHTILDDGVLQAGFGSEGQPGGTIAFPDISTPGVQSDGYNLVNFRGPTTGWVASDLADGTEPLLGSLDFHGGRIEGFLPLEGSPARNGGAPGTCSATEDQNGFPRPQQGACDIGALELRSEDVFANGFE